MTTIIVVKGKDYIAMASDSQVTSGNLALPVDYNKIESVGEQVIVGGCGSVGNTQNVLKRAKVNVTFQKLEMNGGDYTPIAVCELARELADLNFTLPLQHKYYSSFGYIVAGLDNTGDPRVYAIGDDGSKIEADGWWADGSGSQLASGLLQESYNPNYTKEEAMSVLARIIAAVAKQDVFTGASIRVWFVSKEGIGSQTMTPVYGEGEKPEPKAKPKPVKDVAKDKGKKDD